MEITTKLTMNPENVMGKYFWRYCPPKRDDDEATFYWKNNVFKKL